MLNRITVYVSAGIVLFLLMLNCVRTIPNAVEDVSHYPDMTYEQIMSKHKEFYAQVNRPLSSYDEYFEVVDGLIALELACKKYERNHTSLDPRYPMGARAVLGSIEFLRAGNENRSRQFTFKDSKGVYDRVAAAKNFEAAKAKRGLTLSNMVLFPKMDPQLERRFRVALALFQLLFMPFAFVIYWIRVRDEGGSIIFEVVSNPLLPLYILLWEVGLFKYRASGLQVQVRRVVRYASLTVSAVLSFGAATMKAQTKKEGDRRSQDNHTIVISGSSHYLSGYLGLDGAVFHPAPVVQSSLAISHKSGFSLGLWKSISTTKTNQNPDFGFEEDYSVGYGRKLKGRTVSISATYFNVSPLSRLAKGDLLQEDIRITNLVPRLGFSNYLWVRNVHPLRDGKPPGGLFVHFGGTKEAKISKRSRVAVGGEAVFDSGAFGFKRAGIGRFSAAFKLLFKGLAFDLPTYRMSVPFTRPGDGRKFENVLGVGLSFQFAP